LIPKFPTKAIWTIEHSSFLNCVAFTPNSENILTATENGFIYLWKTSGDFKSLRVPKKAHEDAITSISFTSDGSTFATGSKDKTVRIWSLSQFKETCEPLKFELPVVALSFCPDPTRWKLLASISECKGGKLQIYDLDKKYPSGRQKYIFEHQQGLRCMSYSPDGSYLAAAAHRKIRFWDTRTGKRYGDVLKLTAQCSGDVSTLTYATDNRIISIRKWYPSCLDKGFNIRNLDMPSYPNDVIFSNRTEYLA
jgi:WD40 repeat protein